MESLRHIKVIVAFTLVIALLLVACAAPAPAPILAPTPTPSPTPAPAPVPKPTPSPSPTGPSGELRIALASLAEQRFNPSKVTATAQLNAISPLFDAFAIVHGPGLEPGVVERWEMAADGLSWTYFVRRGIKFHNGDDLTAEDVKFSLQQYVSKDAIYAAVRQSVERVEVVDSNTVRVYTLGRQAYLPYFPTLNTSLPQGQVLPKNYIEQRGVEYFESHPIGSGPFKFVRNVLGDMVQYEALDKHWRQTPAFKKLSVILMPEESTRVASLKTGTVDVIDVGIEAANDLDVAGFRTTTLESMYPSVNLHGAYNPAGASFPIADVRVRQALSLAINRDEVRKTFFYGKALPPMPPYVSEINSADLDLPFWKDYATKIYRYDPVEAKRLLKDAGYADGFSIKLHAFTVRGSPYLPRLAEVVQAYWAKIGVRAEIVPIEQSVYSVWRKGPAPQLMGQAATFRWVNDAVLTRGLGTPFHSKGLFGILGTAFPELDKLLDDAATEVDKGKRMEMLAKAIKMGADTYASIMISSAPVMAALGPRVDIDFPQPAIAITLYADLAKHRKQQ